MWREQVKLRAVRLRALERRPTEFNAQDLHPEAEPEIGYPLLARIPRRPDHAFDAAVSEPAGHDDSVQSAQPVGEVARFQLGRVDPLDVHLPTMVPRGVPKRLVDTDI